MRSGHSKQPEIECHAQNRSAYVAPAPLGVRRLRRCAQPRALRFARESGTSCLLLYVSRGIMTALLGQRNGRGPSWFLLRSSLGLSANGLFFPVNTGYGLLAGHSGLGGTKDQKNKRAQAGAVTNVARSAYPSARVKRKTTYEPLRSHSARASSLRSSVASPRGAFFNRRGIL